MDVAGSNTVVLLHGLARGAASMEPMARALAGAGFQSVNRDYPSTSATVADLADATIGAALSEQNGASVVHFVTHSLGGILVRAYAARHGAKKLGRVVMLGPPNSGSQLVDMLRDLPAFGWTMGPAGGELGTDGESLVNSLGPANFETGIIAGTVSLNPLYSSVIDGPNDGKVAVDATRLDGMADHLTLPVSHTWMMMNPLVMAQTIAFIRHGRFSRALGYGEAVQQLLVQPRA
ncbi:MAG: alpha/beta fold hydrolase [Pseudomonadota bacterium]